MFAVIRIRGTVETRKEVEDTLKMLRLNAPNNCVVIPETPDYKGMVEKCRNFITYGEINKETLVKMIKKRLRLKDGGRVDEATLKKITGYASFENFAAALLEEKVRLKDFKELQPIFRLTPPSKGFKSIKENYPKGDLGYRGEKINELIERMV